MLFIACNLFFVGVALLISCGLISVRKVYIWMVLLILISLVHGPASLLLALIVDSYSIVNTGTSGPPTERLRPKFLTRIKEMDAFQIFAEGNSSFLSTTSPCTSTYPHGTSR